MNIFKRQFLKLNFFLKTNAPIWVIWSYYRLHNLHKLSNDRLAYVQHRDAFRNECQSFKFDNDWFTDNIPTWLTAFKENGFQENRAINVLEIGSWQGMSANFILGYFKYARLTCVDTWDGADEHGSHDASDKSILSEIENTFDINIQEYSERVTKHKCTSYEFFNNFFEIDKFDLIYVDGSHHSDDVIVDAIKAFEMLKTDGVMILDDYFWHYYKNEIDNPAGAINSFLRLKKHQLKILCFDYQLVVKKTSSSVRWRE